MSLGQFYDKYANFELHSLVGICLHRINAVIFQRHNVTIQHLNYVHDIIFSFQ